MKKQFVSNSTRKNVLRFGFAALLALSLSSANASPAIKGEEPLVSVKYAGTAEEMAKFQVDLINDGDEAYLFSIQDQYGEILYKEKVTKPVFTKVFAWNNTDVLPAKLIFTVTGEKSKKTQVYEVSTLVRTVRDLEITKL